MSYFPGSDQERLRSTVNDHTAFTRTPPASSGLYRPNHDWSSSNAASGQLTHTSFGFSWPNQAPQGFCQASQGLGLFPMSNNASGTYYQTATTAPQAASMPFAWPSDCSMPSQPETTNFVEDARKDSWVDSCDPLSTLLPDALWNPIEQPAPSARAYNASPSLSPYSTSSRPSAMSSPYAHSEGYVQTAGSPVVKLEDFEDRSRPRIHLHSETATLEQSSIVDPGDLLADVKPSLRDHRPVHRKAFSFNDIHQDLVGGKQKREFTKPENANCHCDQCGKLFQRSYNLKAHMETHDPHRDQPHTCQYIGCDKRFVRRTDLLRHEQSVHLKARNFPCPLCDNSFARKDTLRRHVDDGCSKRTEVKKRVSKMRRPSNAASVSGSRRPSLQQTRDPTTAPSPLRQPAQFP